MKILNSTTRDATSEIQTTRVDELQATSELKEKSLLHIIQFDSTNNTYESMKMTAKTFQDKVYEAVNNSFKVKYNAKHDHSNISASEPKWLFGDMVKYLTEKYGTDVVPTEPNDNNGVVYQFIDHVDYDFELLRKYSSAKDWELQQEINDLTEVVNGIDCLFDVNMKLTTSYKINGSIINSNISVNHNKTENSNLCQMSIDDGDKISNEWETPAAGMLVIQGWLDSTSVLNSKALDTAYCVIEANINGSWEIIGVQSVIPNKYITYVGYTLPVHEGLKIRARTGFTVGGMSGGYSNEQDGYDTLANSTVNGFKCQIFARKDD